MKLFLCFFSLAIVSCFASSIPPATLFLVPSGIPTADSNFSVDLYVAGVTDLYSWQADIDYTSSTLSVVSVTEGDWLPSAGSTYFIPGTNNPQTGVIANNADTLLGNVAVTGEGSVLDIVFHATAPGPAAIGTANVILLDFNSNEISSVPAVLSFQIGPPKLGGGAPGIASEPASLGLIAAAGALMVLVGRAVAVASEIAK